MSFGPWKRGASVCKKHLKMQSQFSDWVKGNGWNREQHDREEKKKKKEKKLLLSQKIPRSAKQIIGKNRDIKDTAGEQREGNDKSNRENLISSQTVTTSS